MVGSLVESCVLGTSLVFPTASVAVFLLEVFHMGLVKACTSSMTCIFVMLVALLDETLDRVLRSSPFPSWELL